MKKPAFVNNEVYHVYNRGVEKRLIFGDDKDRFRFIHDLYEFNDLLPILPSNVRLGLRNPALCLGVELPNIERKNKRELLVEILAFCLMPNHYHLLLRQIRDGGIIKFMQKLGTGYTNYFNLKNERVGPLFQGRFKAILVEKEEYFRHLYNYIHVNPLDLVVPEWRENKLNDHKKALEFLGSYRWSSYLDYKGEKNFPSVISKKLGTEILGNEQTYNKDLNEWLSDIQKFGEEIAQLSLE